MTRQEEKAHKIIKVPEGKICDYIDGKFRNDSVQLTTVLSSAKRQEVGLFDRPKNHPTIH